MLRLGAGRDSSEVGMKWVSRVGVLLQVKLARALLRFPETRVTSSRECTLGRGAWSRQLKLTLVLGRQVEGRRAKVSVVVLESQWVWRCTVNLLKVHLNREPLGEPEIALHTHQHSKGVKSVKCSSLQQRPGIYHEATPRYY